MQSGVLQSGVEQSGVLQSGVLQGGVLQSGVLQSGVLQSGVVQSGVLQSAAPLHNGNNMLERGRGPHQVSYCLVAQKKIINESIHWDIVLIQLTPIPEWVWIKDRALKN